MTWVNTRRTLVYEHGTEAQHMQAKSAAQPPSEEMHDGPHLGSAQRLCAVIPYVVQG